MSKYAIAFDVGGLFIKAAVLDEHGNLCPGTYTIYPAESKESKEVILDHFVTIIKHQTNRILDKSFEIYGVGYAFPGPFDYPQGISYIRGIDKFEHLYGVNLREELSFRLAQDTKFMTKCTDEFQIVFENDANLFALGELHSGQARQFNRSICMTIGTGAGSAFIDNGKLVTARKDVPQNGWIFNKPFRASIVDDYISKRGIMRLAKEAGLYSDGLEVKELYGMAKRGNHSAMELFRKFGNDIGQVLNLFIPDFRPDAVIIGGQIAKSRDLFMEGIYETIQNPRILIRTVNETSLSTFVGVANLLKQHEAKAG